MKKIFIILLIGIFIVTGCGNNMNTPTAKVEEFLSKYQNMDSDVLAQLGDVIDEDNSMDENQKKEYRSLMEKQYQNLSYKIKDETITDDSATVDVEIEVYDYATSIRNSKKYYDEHPDEFKTEKDGNDTEKTEPTLDTDGDNNSRTGNNAITTPREGETDKDDGIVGEAVEEIIEDTSLFIDYKIKELKGVTEKVKYDLTFNLSKVDGKWKVDDISEIDRKKIHGLFEE